MGRIAGKVALVTGAGTGMGQAIAELFAAEGGLVVGTGRRAEKLEETRQRIESAGDAVTMIAADVSDEAQCIDLVERTVAEHGRIDILVNAAGMGGQAYRELREGGMNSAADTPTEAWHELLGNNLDSVFYLSKAAVQKMRAQGSGSIVNFGSISAVRGMNGAHAYAAAKAAIQNLTRNMAVVYAREGIRVNCICPGPIDTPMMAGGASLARFDPSNPARFDANPMGRAGLPSEIAYGTLFLASDEASFVNGVVLPIDGGVLACPA